MIGKAQTKSGAPLPKCRLFSGEHWTPLNIAAVRMLCRGVKLTSEHDARVPSTCFYSRHPLPIQETCPGRDFTGTIRGTVAVVGYYGAVSDRTYWVTCCACGVYELIREKTLVEKPDSPLHTCAVCRLSLSEQYHHLCKTAAGKDYETLHAAWKQQRAIVGKRAGKGLLQFIREARR